MHNCTAANKREARFTHEKDIQRTRLHKRGIDGKCVAHTKLSLLIFLVLHRWPAAMKVAPELRRRGPSAGPCLRPRRRRRLCRCFSLARSPAPAETRRKSPMTTSYCTSLRDIPGSCTRDSPSPLCPASSFLSVRSSSRGSSKFAQPASPETIAPATWSLFCYLSISHPFTCVPFPDGTVPLWMAQLPSDSRLPFDVQRETTSPAPMQFFRCLATKALCRAALVHVTFESKIAR